jgi:hypothetical protein
MNNWEPEITNLTFPLMKFHAKKIGADFLIIDERKFEKLPLQLERFQIYDISKNYDWIIQLDADLLMHPDMPDLTQNISKDFTLISRWDLLSKRFKSDHYFNRDGRFISAPGFFTITSDWCRDFWKLPTDIDLETALSNTTPLLHEFDGRKVDNTHIVFDYLISRNIAKYGLKVKSFQEIFSILDEKFKIGVIEDYICHNSWLPIHHKRQHLKNVIEKHWKINIERLPL